MIIAVKLKKIYECDPEKNEKCSKKCCFRDEIRYCYATSNKKAAKIDPETGKPKLLRHFNMIEWPDDTSNIIQ